MTLVDNKWVKLQQDTIEISSSKNAIYTKSCGVFSSVDQGKQNTIYVYTEKSISGLYINNTKLYASTIGGWAQPFVSFAGSDAGTMFQIKTDNTTKIGENIKLYFSTDPSIKFNDYRADNNDIARLTVKINYAQAKIVTRPIINDNSKLNKVLQANTMNLAGELKDVKTVEKVYVPVGQYSTINTPSRTANGLSTTKTK